MQNYTTNIKNGTFLYKKNLSSKPNITLIKERLLNFIELYYCPANLFLRYQYIPYTGTPTITTLPTLVL